MIQLETDLKKHFSLHSISEKQFEAFITLPENLSYFQGHFPEFSVLPAVGLIDISIFLVRQQKSLFKTTALKNIERLKIKSPLGPKQKILIQFLQQDDFSFEATWFLESAESKLNIAEISFAFDYLHPSK